MGRNVRVVLVDDEPRLRAAWEKLINQQADMTVVESLPCADRLIERVPDGDSVMLLDLSMPGSDPLAAVAELRIVRPACRAIIHSAYNDPDTARAAVNSGAWGFVDKLGSPDMVLAAVRRVADGEAVFPNGSFGGQIEASI
jgi:DNA-binding NarL/FixJ family response regulator